MTHFKVTHSAFRDIHADIDVPAASLVVNGEARAVDLVTRLLNCGAPDAKVIELTSEEYAAERLARTPPQVRK